MTTLTHVSDLAAGYAFGALTDAERAQVETHSAGCVTCAEIIREAERAAALLPYTATPYQAPAELKRAVLDAARAEAPAGASEEQTAPSPPAPEPVAAPQPRRPRPTIHLQPWVADLLLRTLPWTLAVIGWLVVAALVIFSHGQADRINTMNQDDQATIAALTGERDRAEVIQQFLLTPGVAVAQMTYQAGSAPHTNVVLFEIPGYIHAVVGARGLAVLPKGMIYAVWARHGHGPYISLGMLTTSGPAAQGVAVVVAPMPIDQYSEVGITVEHLPLPQQPGRHLAFVARL